jgi:hypothetical protein
LANLFLSFHPEGKYAVTTEEKVVSYTVLGPILAGLLFGLIALVFQENESSGIQWFGLALASASLALPFNYLRYPLRDYQKNFRQWMGLITVSLGMLAVLTGLFLPGNSLSAILMGIYGPIWFIGMWISAFTK